MQKYFILSVRNTLALCKLIFYTASMEQRKSLFEIFGGVRPMARALALPPQNVNAWKRVGRIPAEKQPLVLTVAKSLGLPITANDIIFPLGSNEVSDGGDNRTIGKQDRSTGTQRQSL
jgi:hypothetical protein